MTSWPPVIEKIEGEIHRRYLAMAYRVAWDQSEDSTTKTGAVIVSPSLERVFSSGANHFPYGTAPTPEQLQDRNWKYDHIIHAEPSAIFSAARNYRGTGGAVMYMPWIPCISCANAIVDSGIQTLVSHEPMILKTPERWIEKVNEALSVLQRGGVKKLVYSGEIGGVQSLFDGVVWNP